MTKTKTVEEQTIHGSIEYSVVECDSCGQDVMEDEANEFVIGDREGYACDVCKDEGPVGFPEKKIHDNPVMMLVVALGWPVCMLAYLDDPDIHSEFDVGWLAASLGASLWMFVLGASITSGIL